MSHISADRVDAVLSGEAPVAKIRQWIAHLEDGCEECEQLIDGQIDLETLALLIEAEEAEPVAPAAAEAEAIWRQSAPRNPANRRVWAGVGAVLLMAALALIAFTGVIGPQDDPLEGVKGVDGVAPEVALRVLTGVTSTGGFDLRGRLERGATLDQQTTLIFELQTNMDAARYLFVVDSEGKTTVLFPTGDPAIEEPGRRKVATGADWVALDLEDWNGELTVVAAASTSPMAPAEVTRLYSHSKHPAGLSYDLLTAKVVP